MKRGKFNIVFGGQAGSEGKGKMAAYLVEKFRVGTVAASLSPNAGHTVIMGEKRFVTHHIPCGVFGGAGTVILGPATVINPDVFSEEVVMVKKECQDLNAVMIDKRAAIITREHVAKEHAGLLTIGSTAQGVGEARADKIMRRGIFAENTFGIQPYALENTAASVIAIMEVGGTVLYEMGQGFDLCLEHGIDPIYCTSKIVNPQMALAEMGVPAKYLGDVYAVIRTYPIRVNNRDGTSGPYPSDEITWKEVRERCEAPYDLTEMTTTTKLPRRVFEFSKSRIMTMVKRCDPTYLCLQFANYLDWSCYGATSKVKEFLPSKVKEFVYRLQLEVSKPVAYIGTGPDHRHMVDMGIDDGRERS